MQELTSILEFKDVTVRSASSQVIGVSGLDLALKRGEINVIILEEGRENTPLAQLAQGLLAPDSGKVLFDGEDWAEMKAGRQSVQRGRTRRVFEHYGWITNLDVMENLCLAEEHHTSRSFEEIALETKGLARRFGIDPIPDARPTRVHSMMLRKLEWVRAFVGSPDLIIMERPFYGAPRADGEALVLAAYEAARKGVAVLLLTDETRYLDGRERADVRRFRMDGEKLVAVSSGRESGA